MQAIRFLTGLSFALSACSAAVGQDDTSTASGYACRTLPAPEVARSVSNAAVAMARDGKAINALLTTPSDGARAVVVFLHGYTGTRDEIRVRGGDGMFARAARAFGDLGIASLRFDFVGSGDSDGAWADTTFDGQTADLASVLAALRTRPDLAGLPVYALGFSQGGLVALQGAAAGAGLDGIVLWNPVLDPFHTYAGIFGDAVLQDGLARARAGTDAAIVPGARLKPGFFAGIDRSDPAASAAAYGGPILIVTGTRDGIAANGPANSAALKAQRKGLTEIMFVTADHALNVTRNPETIDEVIACSAGFIAEREGFPGTGPADAPGVPTLK